MFNVYEVKIEITYINDMYGGYEDITFTCLVFSHYPETARRVARNKLLEEYAYLNNLSYCSRYQTTLKLENVLKGAC